MERDVAASAAGAWELSLATLADAIHRLMGGPRFSGRGAVACSILVDRIAMTQFVEAHVVCGDTAESFDILFGEGDFAAVASRKKAVPSLLSGSHIVLGEWTLDLENAWEYMRGIEKSGISTIPHHTPAWIMTDAWQVFAFRMAGAGRPEDDHALSWYLTFEDDHEDARHAFVKACYRGLSALRWRKKRDRLRG